MWNMPVFYRDSMDWMDREWKPACDVIENGEHFLVSVETPGVSKDDIRVEFADGELVISGSRAEEKTADGESWYTERRFGKFQRRFTLPNDIDTHKIEAHYQDGVLKILLPKAEGAKPRQIKISSGSSSGLLSRFIRQKPELKADQKDDQVA